MGRGGRDRFRRDHNSRSEDKSQHERNSDPPSRRLWVGNLSHHISESELSEHFVRFGELESIAFQPGRSYAFVNFMKDEDALIAVRALQGFVLAGSPLKIEFAKAVIVSISISICFDALVHFRNCTCSEFYSPLYKSFNSLQLKTHRQKEI